MSQKQSTNSCLSSAASLTQVVKVANVTIIRAVGRNTCGDQINEHEDNMDRGSIHILRAQASTWSAFRSE